MTGFISQLTYNNITGPNSYAFTVNANPRPSPAAAVNQPQEGTMAKSQTYEIIYTDSSNRLLEAVSVEESNNRLRFLANTEDHLHGDPVVVLSVRSDKVDTYRVVPTREVPTVGKHTYKVVRNDGTFKTVRADKVLYSRGSDQVEKSGLYTLITVLKDSSQRIEYTVGESLVDSVERVEVSQDAPDTISFPTADAVTDI